MKRLLLIAVVACTHTLANAGGPVYSRFGIGDLLWFGSSRAMAMGGLGFALQGEGFVNIINPAGLSGIRYTRFDGSFSYNSYSSTAGGLSGTYWRSGLQNIAVAIPIDTSLGIVMSLESAPYSSVGYNTERTVTQSGVVTTQSLIGSGGLSTLSLGGSVNILRAVSVGAKASYLYGRTQQFVVIDFENSRFTDDQQDRSTYHNAVLLSLGALVNVGRTAFLPGDLSIGLSLDLPASPSTQTIRAYQVLDTAVVSDGSADIPLRIGVGASLVMQDRYTAIADLVYQDWSSVPADAPGSLQRALRLSAGFEIMPDRTELNFLNKIGYRVGFGYEQTYVSVSGTAIDNIFGTVGTSLPVGPGRLNLSLQAGIRGTTSGGLQKDTYVSLNLGITSNEVWFMEFLED